jgi:hypothetical protein
VRARSSSSSAIKKKQTNKKPIKDVKELYNEIYEMMKKEIEEH